MARLAEFKRVEGVSEVDLWAIHDLLESGNRKEFVQAVEIVNRYVAGDKKYDNLILYLIEAAVPYHRVNKLRKLTKKTLSERWTNRNWVEPWFYFACLESMAGNWLMGDGRLVRWVKKGRLDDQIDIMARLAAAHPEQTEFVKMVEKRLSIIKSQK